MSRFSKKTIKKLKQAGWRQNRKTDLEKIRLTLDKSTCFLTKDMENFISEFQDIRLSYQNNYDLFDFSSFFHEISIERCNSLKSVIGEKIFQIGLLYNSDFMVVITDMNRMYALSYGESDVFLLGESFDEGIEFICTHSEEKLYKSQRKLRKL